MGLALFGQVPPEIPWPATGGLLFAITAVVGAWLRAVLLAQAAAKEQGEGWSAIIVEKDRTIERKDREIERLTVERDEARAELLRVWRERQGGPS